MSLGSHLLLNSLVEQFNHMTDAELYSFFWLVFADRLSGDDLEKQCECYVEKVRTAKSKKTLIKIVESIYE